MENKDSLREKWHGEICDNCKKDTEHQIKDCEMNTCSINPKFAEQFFLAAFTREVEEAKTEVWGNYTKGKFGWKINSDDTREPKIDIEDVMDILDQLKTKLK
jgi:hypothetical protein